MKAITLLIAVATSLATSAQSEPLMGGVHTGAGMGYDSETAHPAFQMSVGASVGHAYLSLNKTFPFDNNAHPTLLQLKLGYIVGPTGPKAIFYGGVMQRTMKYRFRNSQSMMLYPERYEEYRYHAITYGVEMSMPLAPKTRICLDLNLSTKPLEDDKERYAKTRVQFLPIVSFKCLLGKKDDCYPRSAKD